MKTILAIMSALILCSGCCCFQDNECSKSKCDSKYAACKSQSDTCKCKSAKCRCKCATCKCKDENATCCKSCKQKCKHQKKECTSNDKQLIGGWYPVFFDKFDRAKVDSIIDSIKQNRVKSITISYDQNEELAEKVKEAIQEELNFAVMMDQTKTEDTDTVEFDHNRVVVTVYQ